MGRTGTTRERIVDAAAELFHSNGFRSTSLAAVGERAGVRGGSLYYFFKTKEKLLQAVLERYGDLLLPRIVEPALADEDDPVERVFGVLDRYRALLRDTDFGLGCPIGNLAIEMIEADPGTRAGLAASFDLWAGTMEGILAGAADRFPAGTDLHRLSRFLLTVMEGGVLLARGYRDIRPFDDAIAELRGYFDRLQGRKAATGGPKPVGRPRRAAGKKGGRGGRRRERRKS